MRRAVVTVVLSLLVSGLTSGLSSGALGGALPGAVPVSRLASAEAAPRTTLPVARAVRAYGGDPLRLAPGQDGEITFRARRRDEVLLQVVRRHSADCRGRVTLTDGRGPRSKTLSHVFRVRTDGRTTIRFHGACYDDPVRIRLTKLRSRRVPVDGRSVRLGPPRQGFLDVAWARVPRHGRVQLMGRDGRGRRVMSGPVLVGDQLVHEVATDASFERGQPVVGDTEGYWVRPGDPVMRRGTRVGLTFNASARVEARTALTHTVELDGPPLTLGSDRGREHVIAVDVPAGTRPYLDASWDRWRDDSTEYWLEPRPRVQEPNWVSAPWETSAAGTYRLVLAWGEDEPDTTRTIRIRSVLTAPDLVLGGPPVRLESAEPGQWVLAHVPSPPGGAVRLTATDATVTGGGWTVRFNGPCHRDCPYFPELTAEKPVLDGHTWFREPHLALLELDHGASGGVTLRLEAGLPSPSASASP